MEPSGSLTVQELTGLLDRLAVLPTAGSDAERIDRIQVLEKIKAATAAAQAIQTTDFATSQRAAQEDAGVPARRLGRGIADQIALARKVSPTTGSRYLTFAQTLTGDLPHTFKLLAGGDISEWVATIMTRETAELSRADRRRLDADLAAELPHLSPRQAEANVRRAAIEADPESVLRRGRTARKDRRVSIRPAPDTMAQLTGFVPAEQGIAAWANLRQHAQSLKAQGDPRGLGQIMSDTYIERLTGQSRADIVPAEIGITMTAGALIHGDDDVPATLADFGPIPAGLARDIATRGHQATEGTTLDTTAVDHAGLERAEVFLRRLFTDPVDETVARVDAHRRRFDGTLAALIRYRDQTCSDPYCSAPIRHLDHVTPHRSGGSTTVANGQGRCERGNYTKDMPGWHVRVDRARHTTVTTPTGHTYTAQTPTALGATGSMRQRSHRRALRRLQFLQREQLIANLPSP